jgi:hypothetical protein
MESIYYPIYLQIYERKGTRWLFHEGKVFYNAHGVRTDLDSTLERNNLTRMKVVIEMFRINGGKSGFYLADIKDKKYHYCGDRWEDVKAKLRELGIGRDDPVTS